MDRLWIALVLIGVFVIGRIYLVRQLSDLRKKLDFLREFQNKFTKLANTMDFTANFGTSYSLDHQLYNWLSRNSVKAQKLVGWHGIGDVIAPFQIWKARNYQFIINTIPKLREGMVHYNEITMVDDCLTRCIGDEEEAEQDLMRDLKNPIKWLQHGVRLVIGFPVRLLKWFGIIPDYLFSYLTHNWIFKLLSGLIALVGFVGGVVGIVTGWDKFLQIVNGWVS